MIGKDEASTVEYLKYEKMAQSNSQSEMLNEECGSINSQTDFITNEEMLTHLYGKTQHIKPNDGYYSDSSMILKKGLPNGHIPAQSSGEYIQSSSDPYFDDAIGTENQRMSNIKSQSGREYIHSSNDPYFDDTIAMEQFRTSPPSIKTKATTDIDDESTSTTVELLTKEHFDDPNNGYSSSFQQSLQTASITAEYIPDRVVADQYNNTSVDVSLDCFNCNTAVDQNGTKEAVLLSYETKSVPLVDSVAYPYAKLNEDMTTASMPDLFAGDYIGHNDGKVKHISEQKTNTSSQAVHSVYTGHNLASTHHNSIVETASYSTERTPLHKTLKSRSESVTKFGYISMNDKNDGGYISES